MGDPMGVGMELVKATQPGRGPFDGSAPRPPRRVGLLVLVLVAMVWLTSNAAAGARVQPRDNLSPGQVSAGESDPLPTQEETEMSEVAHRVFGLPEELASSYPGAYAGVVVKSSDHWTIRVIEGAVGAEELQARVAEVMAEAITRVGKTIHFDVEPAEVTQARRDQVNSELSQDLIGRGKYTMMGLTAVGLNANGIYVEVDSGRESAVNAELGVTYPDIMFEVAATKKLEPTADRYADRAPWNGGDFLAVNFLGVTVPVCTSGAGAHSSSGQRFLLYAGHCGSAAAWYNTNLGSPQSNNPLGGGTAGLLWQSGSPDIASISANSSRYFWQGPGGGRPSADDRPGHSSRWPSRLRRGCSEGCVWPLSVWSGDRRECDSVNP